MLSIRVYTAEEAGLMIDSSLMYVFFFPILFSLGRNKSMCIKWIRLDILSW